MNFTHIGMEKPTPHGGLYVNRYQYPTINVQETCHFRVAPMLTYDSLEKHTTIESREGPKR